MSWFTKAGLNTIVPLWGALWCPALRSCSSRGSLYPAVLHSLHSHCTTWRWCSLVSLSRKIQCTLTNRFSLNNPLTQKSELCTRLMVGCQSQLFFAILVFEWRGFLLEREQRSQIYLWLVYCREFRSTIKYGLKVNWMLLNGFEIYLKTSSKLFQGQICQWEENLERLQVEQFRLRCYMSSLQASELPNPKVRRTLSILLFWRTYLFLCHKFLGKRNFHQ